MLPLIAYGGGVDSAVVYHSKDTSLEVRTNLVVVTALESGGGKTVNYNYCSDVLAQVAEAVEPTLIRRFMAKKNKKAEVEVSVHLIYLCELTGYIERSMY